MRIPNLSSKWQNGLSNLVSVENEEKETAVREQVWGAQKLADKISLAHKDADGTLVLPRGFQHELENMLRSKKIEYEIEDQTSEEVIVGFGDPSMPNFRKPQEDALRAMRHNDQGRIIAPPGTGKTWMGIGAIKESGRSSLIIVEKKHIAQQWIDNASEHFGLEVGFIGDNKWEEKDITVALVQTLWSRREELDKDNWWTKWSMLLLDEQHHIPAKTFTEVISRFPAKKRFGLSATVGKSEAKKRVSELIFGPILYEATNVQVKPKVVVVHTGFDFPYHPTQKIGKKVIRNNYQSLIKKLVNDPQRNDLITEIVAQNSNRANLVISRRLNHLEALRAQVQNKSNMKTYMLTGEESLEERMKVYDAVETNQDGCAVFSTLADEALDIPKLDAIYLTFPSKNEETIWQQIGRVAREHPNKKDALVYDFVDYVDVLKNQHFHRVQHVYQRKELQVEKFKHEH